MQVVNQANVEAIRNEFIDSFNSVVDQASAKFEKMLLQARALHGITDPIVGGVGHALGCIKWAIAVAMKELESAVPAMFVPMPWRTTPARWLECVNAERNVHEGIPTREKTRLQRFSMESHSSDARGGANARTSWTRHVGVR